MLDRFVAGFRRINRPPPAEDSVALRAAVLVAVLVAAAGAVSQGMLSGIVAVATALLVPAGFSFSWVRRRKDNWWVKLILTFALPVAFIFFVRAVLRTGIESVADTQKPLAELVAWVQIMHSFDLPGRRDLYFSIFPAAAMVAAASVLAVDASYGLFVFGFLAAVVTVFYLGRRAELRDIVEREGGVWFSAPAAVGPARRGARRQTAARTARAVAVLVVSLLLVSTAAFAVAPRLKARKFLGLPFSIKGGQELPSGGSRIENPGLSEGGGGDGDGTTADGGYFGFSNRMDLSVRGRPTDDLVMRVRSDRPAFWRGMAYTEYDGSGWVAESDPGRTVSGDVPFNFAIDKGNRPREVEELVQTFYVATEQPNLVLGAYQARQVYFPAAGLRVDANVSIRSPVAIEEGTVYSVVSQRSVTSSDELRNASSRVQPGTLARDYLQLPGSLPERVRVLAAEITKDAPGIFDKVAAVETWLMENTEYTLDIPPLPPGADAVEQFLFVDRRGFCEQIATAEVVLLRAIGVNARVVAGYTQGRRSVFSSLWEVRGSDAHAWTEIYYPEIGWIESDPTYVVPRAGEGPPSAFGDFSRWLGEKAAALPGWVKAPFRAIGAFFRALAGLSPLALAAAGGMLLVAVALVRLYRRRRRGRLRRALPWGDRLLAEVEEAAQPLGLRRADAQTVGEFALAIRAGPLLGKPEGEALRRLASELEADAFARQPLDSAVRVQAEQDADLVVAALSAPAQPR